LKYREREREGKCERRRENKKRGRRNKDKLAEQLRQYTLRVLNGKKVREKKRGTDKEEQMGVEKGGKDIQERKLHSNAEKRGRRERERVRERRKEEGGYRHLKLNASSSVCRKKRERQSIAHQHKVTQKHEKERERKNIVAKHKVRLGERKEKGTKEYTAPTIRLGKSK
jgi:hypothetical protein